MSEAELARVRDGVARLSTRARGVAAVEAGRGIAAAAVLGDPAGATATASAVDDEQNFSAVPRRWIVFGVIQISVVILPGVSHFNGRGSRLEPEAGADFALISTIVAVGLSLLAVRLLPRMPAPMRGATRTSLLVGSIILPVGFVLGLVRLVLGETSEVEVMLRAAIVQALGAVVLFVLWRRMPSPAAVHGRLALSDEECTRLRAADPETAQRMKDAEIQALLALTSLGQVGPDLAQREAAHIDERWGKTGETSPST